MHRAEDILLFLSKIQQWQNRDRERGRDRVGVRCRREIPFGSNDDRESRNQNLPVRSVPREAVLGGVRSERDERIQKRRDLEDEGGEELGNHIGDIGKARESEDSGEIGRENERERLLLHRRSHVGD